MSKWYVNFDKDDDWCAADEFETKEEAIAYGKEVLLNDYNVPEDYQEYIFHDSFEVGQVEFGEVVNTEIVSTGLVDEGIYEYECLEV